MNEVEKDKNEIAKRLLAKEEAENIIEKVKGFAGNDGLLNVNVNSYWFGSVKWARNEPFATTNSRNIVIEIQRVIGTQLGWVICNQIDGKSIESATRYAEYKALLSTRRSPPDMPLPSSRFVTSPKTDVWSDKTYNRDLDSEKSSFLSLLNSSSDNKLLSAGYLESFAARAVRYRRDAWNREANYNDQLTQAHFSMTTRDAAGSTSGWAGSSSHDYGRISIDALGRLAIDKAISSRDPVRIEPGRYTTILEPQASYTIFSGLVRALNRDQAENGGSHPMTLGHDSSLDLFRSRIGLKIVDERINVSHNPENPDTAILIGEGVSSATLIKNGVLLNMYNSLPHEVSQMVGLNPNIIRTSFSVEGTSTTTEEMIRTTERGLLVTRFDKVVLLDGSTLLSGGLTRDGLWLIEKGKITRAIRNFRFTESPLFALNNVDQIGQAESVYNPVWQRDFIVNFPQGALSSSVVPSIKIRDFSFTSTIDAI